MSNKIYVFKVFERIWHWSQAFLIIALLVTGFEVHGSYSVLGFEKAVDLHTTFAWTLADLQTQVDAGCEGGWSMEKLADLGERIWNMERLFNNAAGFTAKDDDLPKRLKTEAAASGPTKGLVSGVEKMMPEYYKARGWDSKGVPTKETLARLGL